MVFPDLCKTGDVWLEEDGTPLFFWDRKWSPICGWSFWDDNVGATTFCNKLGYKSGTVNKVQNRYPVASVRIGKCGDGDELTACTAGGNFLYSQNDKYCYPQDAYSITIACNEQANGNSSCNMGK